MVRHFEFGIQKLDRFMRIAGHCESDASGKATGRMEGRAFPEWVRIV